MIKIFNFIFGNQTPSGMKVFYATLIVLSLITLPTVAWGWRRWIDSQERLTITGSILFAALLFDSISALLAPTMEIMIDTGRYFMFDAILRLGFYLALGGIALSTGMIWKRSPVRFHVLAAAIGASSYWSLVANFSY